MRYGCLFSPGNAGACGEDAMRDTAMSKASPPARPRPWWHDLGLERGGLRARKTGALVRFNAGNLLAMARGFANYLAVQAMRLGHRAMAARPVRVAFTPDQPRPWYLVWSALHAGGGRISTEPARADAIFYFEDRTSRSSCPLEPLGPLPPSARRINCACLDVSKSRVAAVFEEVFGYPLALDPERWHGPAVEKSERNGAHDGRIITCPAPRRKGKVYERLIDNSDNGRWIEDYRAPTVGGHIPLVYIKQRALDYRFANVNDRVLLRRPEQVFSLEERELLRRFCQAMKLDWGGIDVLRDRPSGRLYVVDVNKTDMGPPTALGLADQARSVRILGRALRAYLEDYPQ